MNGEDCEDITETIGSSVHSKFKKSIFPPEQHYVVISKIYKSFRKVCLADRPGVKIQNLELIMN